MVYLLTLIMLKINGDLHTLLESQKYFQILKQHCDFFLNWPILKSPRGYELVSLFSVILLIFNVIQIFKLTGSEDFIILHLTQQDLFPDWNSSLEKWFFISDRLVSVRKNSAKDKVA